jgi:hypothetical protein
VKSFILWTGLLSCISGVILQLSLFSAHLFPAGAPGVLVHAFGLVAVFLGLMLILCSRDLKNRGVLVAWEGVLRVVGGSVIAGFGFLGGSGFLLGLAGLGDVAIGLVYLVWLPRHLGVSAFDLLLDRRQTDDFPAARNP